MRSINFTFLGDENIVKDFGKKGTSTDITIYDRKDADTIRTWTCPTSFPEKIQALFQAIDMGEYVIFYITKLDKFTGEQIIALDVLNRTKGILCHSYDVDRDKIFTMIKGTVVEQYKIVEPSDLKKEMDSLEPVSNGGPTKIAIDHCFDVKGVGTVVLGKVNSGKVKTYDTLKLLPKGGDVLIKSIQMHDDTVSEAAYPARVGLSVKGLSPDDVQRGDVLSPPDLMRVEQEITLDYRQNRYFKENIGENQTVVVSIGLQARPAKIVSLNPMRLSLGKPAVFDNNDVCVILRPESLSIRIVGGGKII
ncbi:MAG: elongation factor Tu [Candidatus Aenigmarchaeota archaeon]|nr:elongation factor Tu [Candidatus Aenigmarchaeota archaeon]